MRNWCFGYIGQNYFVFYCLREIIRLNWIDRLLTQVELFAFSLTLLLQSRNHLLIQHEW
jgi:hypothetical protein